MLPPPLAPLFTPPFDQTELDPGYIKGYPPGIRENGGQYTHAALWSVIRAEMFTPGEHSHPARVNAVVAASDRHAAGVCRALRNGVLSASSDVLTALVAVSRRPSLTRHRRAPRSLSRRVAERRRPGAGQVRVHRPADRIRGTVPP